MLRCNFFIWPSDNDYVQSWKYGESCKSIWFAIVIVLTCGIHQKFLSMTFVSHYDYHLRHIYREEDNDDVIAIVDSGNIHLKELYGEYCVSEMIRHPSSCRQLIIGEDIDGSAVGVMCLNTTIDINLLNENFSLHFRVHLKFIISFFCVKYGFSNIFLIKCFLM